MASSSGSKPRINNVVTPVSTYSSSASATVSGLPTSAVVFPGAPVALAIGVHSARPCRSARPAASSWRWEPALAGRGRAPAADALAGVDPGSGGVQHLVCPLPGELVGGCGDRPKRDADPDRRL